MSILSKNPASPAIRPHRVQIVAEAVVSAYINEISPADSPHAHERARQSRTDSSPRIVPRSLRNIRPRSRALPPPCWTAPTFAT